MSMKIRLARGGAKKRPYYRIVVADSRSPRDGKFIDVVGSFNPMLGKTDDEITGFQQKGLISPETPIFSPIAGTVVQRKLGPGQYVSYTSTGIVDPAPAAKALNDIGYDGYTVLEIITDAMQKGSTWRLTVVDGAVEAFVKQFVLLEQAYVREPSKTVRQLVEETAAPEGAGRGASGPARELVRLGGQPVEQGEVGRFVRPRHRRPAVPRQHLVVVERGDVADDVAGDEP